MYRAILLSESEKDLLWQGDPSLLFKTFEWHCSWPSVKRHHNENTGLWRSQNVRRIGLVFPDDCKSKNTPAAALVGKGGLGWAGAWGYTPWMVTVEEWTASPLKALHPLVLLPKAGSRHFRATSRIRRCFEEDIRRCCIYQDERSGCCRTHFYGYVQDESRAYQKTNHATSITLWHSRSGTIVIVLQDHTQCAHGPYLLGRTRVYWIQGNPRRFNVYVGNRVSQIVNLIPPDHWNHVVSADNPADYASRGLYPSEIFTR